MRGEGWARSEGQRNESQYSSNSFMPGTALGIYFNTSLGPHSHPRRQKPLLCPVRKKLRQGG